MKPNRRLRPAIASGTALAAAVAALTGCGTTETSTSPGDNAVLSDVVWSPDGLLLAFTRFDGTYVITPPLLSHERHA